MTYLICGKEFDPLTVLSSQYPAFIAGCKCVEDKIAWQGAL